jgi:hypothetical protein
MTKKPALPIIRAIGAHAIATALDVSPHSVRAAQQSGTFPASWYRVVSALCVEGGICCPLCAFNWKLRVHDKKVGGDAGGFQGPEVSL